MAGAGRFPEGRWAGFRKAFGPVSGRPLGRFPEGLLGRLPEGLWHGDPTHRYLSGILAWRRETSGRSSAQRPCLQVLQCHPRVAKGASTGTLARRPLPQVPQWHPRVAKHSSDRSSARRPSTEALLGQGRVPKERESLPLQGLWSSLRPGLARHPRLQIVLRQGRVAKRASIGTLAQEPYPQVPQGHPRVAKGDFWPVFGTATLPTGASETSPRGE